MSQRSSSREIAVIGLACRYPDATTPRQLWENVLARRRQFRRIPDCRMPLADYYDKDPQAADKTYGRQAAVIDGFDFDWAERRIPFSTLRTTDIVHWLALETSLAAMADAGYTRKTLPSDRTGVIIGNTLTGEQTRANTMRLRWPFVRRALHHAAREQGLDDSQIQDLTQILKARYKGAFPPVDEDTLAGGLSNTIAGRICNYLNLRGGGFTVDGACSSSLLAVAHAAARIVDGDLALALVGGVDVSLDPFELVGFSKTGALTSGEMRVYDRSGKGFIPGEGCGFVVLKALSAARRDGDRVYAVIQGWGISSDGGGSGITAPSVSGQALALERAYLRAPHGITDLDFIEGHGTGTTVGDRTELEAIAQVLGQTPVSSGQLRPCGITSLKSIIGHAKAASGIGGLIKAVMAVNRRVIPPTAACRDPHPIFDGTARQLYPVRKGRREGVERSLTAGVSSMGFGGINCHITLESCDEPDDRLQPAISEGALLASAQESELLVLGADNKKALLEKITGLGTVAQGISLAEVADLAAELSRQVSAHDPIRAAIVTDSPDDLFVRLEQLETFLRGDVANVQEPKVTPVGSNIWLGVGGLRPRLGFLFPGQGSQQFNMARTLVQRFAWAQEYVNQADGITHDLADMPISQMIYPETDRASGPDERKAWFADLSRSQFAQPAICLASLLWLEFFKRLGLQPEVVAGHSLGELTACYGAGVFDEATLLEFATRRGQALSDQCGLPGGMVGLRCGEKRAMELISRVEGYLTVANLNSPRQTVLSGEPEAVEAMVQLAREQGVSARRLPVSGAFHSRLCRDAARLVEEMPLLKKEMAWPSCAIFSSMDGTRLKEGLSLNEHFAQQMRSRVDFISLVQNMASHCDLMIEVGPGRVLTGLANEIIREIDGENGPLCLPAEGAADHAADLNLLLGVLYAHGAPIHWEVLYENRLIRPFVPPDQKNFIVNPCETLPRDGALEVAVESAPVAKTDRVLTDAFVNLSEVMVKRYLAARGDFLTQVVQADLAYWDPDARPLAAKELGKTGALKAASGLPTPRISLNDLFQLVTEVTGFPTETLTRDSRLLDDLNLDSIKAGDLVARFATSCGVTFPDPALLANATLGEVTDAALQLRGDGQVGSDSEVDRGGPERGAIVQEAPDARKELLRQAARVTGFAEDALNPDLLVEADLQIGPDKLKLMIQRTATTLGIQANVDLEPLLKRSLGQISEILSRMVAPPSTENGVGALSAKRVSGADAPTWVRNFVMDLVETPYPHIPGTWRMRSENNWERARVLILHSEDTKSVAGVLGHQLFQQGAFTRVNPFEAEDTAEAVQDAAYSHLVAILPKSDQPEMDRAALLERSIRIRASVVPMPAAARAPRRRTTVAWIQFGGGFFGRDPRHASMNCCGAVALGASLHLERPDLRVRVLDFCPALSLETVARQTLAEMVTQADFNAVGYDLDRTRRTLLPRLAQPAEFQKRDIQWSLEDVILVTGGAKGITAACALAVARDTGASMALVGRSSHPDQAPESSASREIQALLEKYADLGLKAEYVSCDMADRDQVTEMLTAVTHRLGRVTGIIHGAGLNRPRLTGQVPPEHAIAETAPKVLGLLHLLDVMQSNPPKLIVGMGSIIGLTGMPGNGWYGFSNEVMDIALRGFAAEHPQTQTVNVAYSIWRDEGMGARMGSVDLLRERGIDAIPTDEGVKRFVKIFTHDPGHAQVVVTARMEGLDTWKQAPLKTPSGQRFLDKPVLVTPNVEAIFSTHLSLKSDPYLKDHHFQGSYLFPTVFGLEAMTQAALHLMDHGEISSLQIRDVQLKRPITVDPETGADITIRALLIEVSEKGETVVQTGIVKEGTGVSEDFFTATLVFDLGEQDSTLSVDLPGTALPLAPQTDLYRTSLLFQGARFQGIQKVWQIRETGDYSGSAKFTASVMPMDERSSAAFGSGTPDRLSLGDPFFIDNLLQMAILLVPQETCLPVSIDRMDLWSEFFTAVSPARVQVELMGREDQDLVYRVWAVGENSQVRAVLSGYRLRILKHHPEYPTVADLVSPEERDRHRLGQMLDDACRKFAVTSPQVKLAYLPGIHDMTRGDRRELELPLLTEALAAAIRHYKVNLSSSTIQWESQGKPVIAGTPSSVLDISLTHEDRACLCACGPGPMGCDLAAISARTREKWNVLLGSHRSPLLDSLIDQGEALDHAGTRVWAATETLAKTGGEVGNPLQVEKKIDDAVLFTQYDGKGVTLRILTLAVRLTWGAPMILAVTVVPEKVTRVPEHLLTADYPGYEPLYETRPYEIIEGGPQGQLVYVQRLPVTFQPSSNLSRTIYFSNFIKWMGYTREVSAWPVLSEMATEFAGGRSGGVTNYGHLKFLGEGRTSDQIEVQVWVSDNSGPKNSTMTLSYDFRQMVKGGGYRRLAFCRLQTTWVEILGPGVAKVAPYPAYYGQFIEDMCPRNDAPDTPEPLEETLGHLFDADQDRLLYVAPSGPVVHPIVREQTFDTTLAHANLVGNIYYANYYEWQGQIRDRFFYELIPDHYGGNGEQGELLALESRVDHLRELMPFDRVLLTLAVKELRSCSVTFHLDYFRLDPDGSRAKVAQGMHRAVWVMRDEEGHPMAVPFPGPVREAMDTATEALKM